MTIEELPANSVNHSPNCCASSQRRVPGCHRDWYAYPLVSFSTVLAEHSIRPCSSCAWDDDEETLTPEKKDEATMLTVYQGRLCGHVGLQPHLHRHGMERPSCK